MPVSVRGVPVPVIATDVKVKRRFLEPGSTACAPPDADPQAPVKTLPLVVTGGLAVASVAGVWAWYGPQFGVVLALGVLLGSAMFHSRFGFMSGWQQLVSVGNGQGVRAQLLLLGTAASAVAVIAGTGLNVFGTTPHADAGTLGLGLVIGAAMFGVGMQLAGSCASGTLFAVGAGQPTILLTLAGFVSGAVFYTWAYPLLGRLPHTGGVLLSDHLGWFGSWLVTVTVLLVAAVVTLVVQHRRNPPPVGLPPTSHGIARIYRGSWPTLVGAAVIGVLAGLVFLASGRVLGLSGAFALWGAKLLQAVGLHPETWAFWRENAHSAALSAPLLTDTTSLTNFGIMIGAAAAAAAAGAWQLRSSLPRRISLALLLGGFLMGLGSRMADGCNIGALLGGISVGSVRGWVWAACALVGAWLGMRMRPLFGLSNPKAGDSIC